MHTYFMTSSCNHRTTQPLVIYFALLFWGSICIDAAEMPAGGVKIVRSFQEEAAPPKMIAMNMMAAKNRLKNMEEDVQDVLVATIGHPVFSSAMLDQSSRSKIPTSSEDATKVALGHMQTAAMLHKVGVFSTHAEMEAFGVVKALRADPSHSTQTKKKKKKFEDLIRSRFSPYYRVAKICRSMTKALSVEASVAKRQASIINTMKADNMGKSKLLLSRLTQRSAQTRQELLQFKKEFSRNMKVIMARYAQRKQKSKDPKTVSHEQKRTQGKQGKVQMKLPISPPRSEGVVAVGLPDPNLLTTESPRGAAIVSPRQR